MKLSDLTDMVDDWHMHKTDYLAYPTIVIMNQSDYDELAKDCNKKKNPISDYVYVNKVTGLSIAIWKNETESVSIL